LHLTLDFVRGPTKPIRFVVHGDIQGVGFRSDLDFLPHRGNLGGQENPVPHLSPTTLTTDEQALILRATAANLRDHTIISLALGTGLRLAEIVGLDVSDVYAQDGTPRVRVRVRKEIAKGGRAADVFLPHRLVTKLKRFWRWKRDRGEDLATTAPLFCNQSRRRISKRRVQFAWATWQRRAGFDRVYGFHCLRHSAISSVYAMTHDLFLAQRFARHVSPLTTTVYTHPSDEDMASRLRALGC
jgi:integrase